MIRDLRELIVQSNGVEADVAVIGAGIAGLLMADRLVKAGQKVLVLESGSDAPNGEPHPLNEVSQQGTFYRGATEGRFRGIGGTSTRWGGAMLPFMGCDMDAHTAGWAVNWPVKLGEVVPYFAELERLFDLPSGGFEIKVDRSSSDFLLRSAKWPVFGKRNVANVVDLRNPQIDVLTNATVNRISVSENGAVRELIVSTPEGRSLSVRAKLVVIAAGAIESTRLLLLLDRQNANRIFKKHGVLGHYFFDHLSANIAKIDSPDHRLMSKHFGFRFQKGGMRDLRIEPTVAFRRKEALPAAFAHIAFESEDSGGFAALRELLRQVQSKSAIEWRLISPLIKDREWLLQAAFWKLARRRLLAPADANFHLRQVIEQMPQRASQISLDPRRIDRDGNPLALIAWQMHEQDFDAFSRLQSEILTWWAGSLYRDCGKLKPVDEADWRSALSADGGIFHPGGTTRMGQSPLNAVVDRDLKVFEMPNLYVVSTSTFPSGGGANPTFMLMCFALRAADHLARRLGPVLNGAPS